ncbi:MAG: hypothetical protein KDD21_03500 [Bacteroidetes bacterium]|nr:hypothetical protein [Bacteroidota bacterium]
MKINKISLVLLAFLFPFGNAIASDDVYDAPVQHKLRVKSTNNYSSTSSTNEEVRKTVPYYEDGNSTSPNSNIDERQYSDDFSGGSNSYVERIRRFHNPSIQFSYGWNNWDDNFYQPWSSYNNYYGWNNYAYTPSWMYDYSNFYNPFWNSSPYTSFYPGYSSWYNMSYYSPSYSWGYSPYGYGYGWSPYCANTIINNNYYGNYGHQYDYPQKNVIYTPRTGTYSNSTITTGTRGKDYPSNTNSNNWNVQGNSNNNSSYIKQNNTPKKWTNENSNYNKGSENNGWSNPFKNDNNNDKPSNNNQWNNSNSNNSNSGIKIGSRPK